MAKKVNTDEVVTKKYSKKKRPALNPENEENQMIALATNLAKQKLIDGTASSQLICHYLNLSTTKAKLEKEKLVEENKLLKAKTESIQTQKDIDESYKKVIQALKDYSGVDSDEY